MNTDGNEPNEDRGSAVRGGAAGVLEPLVVAAALVLAVSYRSFEPIWRVGTGVLALGVLSGLAYLAGYVLRRRAGRPSLGNAVVVMLVVSQPVLLVLWAIDLPVSRIALAGELSLLFAAIAAAGPRAPATSRVAVAFGLALMAMVPTVVGLSAPATHGDLHDGPEHRYLFTSYHDVEVAAYRLLPEEVPDGGALTLLPDGRVLLVTGGGTARLLDIAEDVHATPVTLGLPLDVAGYAETGRYQPEFYRVFDVLYHDGRLFASYIHWDSERDCYALRLAEAEFEDSAAGPWKTRFESRPCVPLPYTYNTSGGRIAVLDDAHLLLSVGTFGMDHLGPDRPHYDQWQDTSDYGKLLVLDRETWRYEVFTKGHRNPEGLLVTRDRIWSTEHGPHGGDELNLIEPGSDYGWPFVSYGTDYGRKTLDLGATPGDHTGYAEPVFAWIPSIGVSNLIEVEGDLFPHWRRDLLVGSLSGLGNGHALFRVRLQGDRAVSVERIPVDSRVRDLLQLPGGGPLVLWDSDGTVRIVRPADHVFSQCTGCHNVRNAQHGIGPDLYGVVGSPVARHDNYSYSQAMAGLGGFWSPELLDRFLADPQGEVPGTSMEHEGVESASDRAEIIQFLSEVSAGRPVN